MAQPMQNQQPELDLQLELSETGALNWETPYQTGKDPWGKARPLTGSALWARNAQTAKQARKNEPVNSILPCPLL